LKTASLYTKRQFFYVSYHGNIEEKKFSFFRILKISKREKNSFFVYSKYRRERKTPFSYTQNIEERKKL